MLVQDWMTTNVITITPDTPVLKAKRLLQDNSIRRLPVVDDDGKLVGIVSDRDIKEVSPSKATTLDVHELNYLLAEMKVKDVMTKKPVYARPTDSIESLAYSMMEKRFGGIPIVDDNHRVCGIISDSDIFKVLVAITGIKSGGIQLAFELPNAPGTLRPVFDMLREHNAGVVSVLTSLETASEDTRRVYIRLRPLGEEQQKDLLACIKECFNLLYWEPGFSSSTSAS